MVSILVKLFCSRLNHRLVAGLVVTATAAFCLAAGLLAAAETSPPQPPSRVRVAPTADHPTNPAVRARLKLAGSPEKVVELDLSKADLTDADLVCLVGLPNLMNLNLASNPEIKGSGLKYLRFVANLRSLNLAYCRAEYGPAIAGLAALEELNLSGTAAGGANLGAVARLPSLRVLDVTNANFSDKALLRLQGMNSLRVFRARTCNLTDAGFASFKKLPQIEEIEIGGMTLSGSGLESLSALRRLRRLSIKGSTITVDAITHASGLRQLESLELSSCRVTDAGLKHLEGLTNLRELNLLGADIDDRGLESLKGMRGLRKLNLDSTKISADGMATIGLLTGLEELEVFHTGITKATRVRRRGEVAATGNPFEGPPEPGPYSVFVNPREIFAYLKGLVHLRRLDLSEIPNFHGDGLDQLATLPQLSELDLSGDQLSAAGQKQLLMLPHLERLVAIPYGLDAGLFDLRNLRGLQELEMRDGWYSPLSFRLGQQLPNLRKLTLTALPGHPNAVGLGPLSKLPGLRQLELGSPYLDNAGILQQTGLGQIETLVLDAPKVTDDGLKFLDGWKGLKDLTVHCQLTDGGLAPIVRLTGLRSLTIANTWITDAGLKRLSSLGNLLRLDVSSTACTPAGVGALQSSLPDCEIISGGPAPLPPGQFVVPDGSIE